MRPDVRLASLAPLALPLAFACARPPQAPPLTPDPESPPVASAGSAPAASGGGPYSGHGAESIPPEILAKFRPGAVPAGLSQRVESLIDVRAPGIGRLSPDGKALYFEWNITGINQLWKLDGPHAFPHQLTGGEDATSAVAMTPDGAWLVVQRDRKGEENPGLYLQPVAGGALVPVQHLPKVQTLFEVVSPDSKYVYFTANDKKPDSYTIYRWNVSAGVREVVFEQEGLWHVSDIRPDGRLLLRKETGSLSAEFSEYDPAKSELTPLFGQGEKEEFEAQYGAKNGEIIVLTNKAGEYRRMYSWTGPGQHTALGEEAKADVSWFDIDQKRTRILYVTNEGGYHRPHALDARTLKPIALPKLPDADQVMFRTGRLPDPSAKTSASTTGAIRCRATSSTGRAGPSCRHGTPPARPRSTRPSSPARSSTRTRRRTGRASRSSSAVPRSARPIPVRSSRISTAVPRARRCRASTWRRRCSSTPASCSSSPTCAAATATARRGRTRTTAPSAWRSSRTSRTPRSGRGRRSRPTARSATAGVYGGSYGGYSVLMAMTMFAGDYDAGVDVVGISDLRTFLRNTAPYRRALRISEYGDPDADADALAKLSPMTYIDRVKAPLLIMQGASDPRVPAGESVQIHDSLEKKGVACDLTIFSDEGHGPQKRENRVYLLAKSIEFFKKYLLGS